MEKHSLKMKGNVCMMNTKQKRILRAGFLGLCITVMGTMSTLVYAEPSTGELEQKTSGLKGELNDLNSELNSLSTELESATSKTEEVRLAMESTQKKLDEAQKKGQEQYEAMKLRIKYMYEAGDTSFFELLCSAENMSDFLNKTDFIKTVSEYDRDMLQALIDTQNEIKAEGKKLEEQRDELANLKESISVKRASLESKVSSTSSELSQYSSLLERAKAAEQDKLVQAQQNAGTGSPENVPSAPPANSVPNTPGSSDGKTSLGTFKISHYCPCFYCCGGWGTSTSTGTTPTAGRTIAVDPTVIPYGSRVIINGNVYIAEDSGGAIKGNRIDIFMASHGEALSAGVYYTEVFME